MRAHRSSRTAGAIMVGLLLGWSPASAWAAESGRALAMNPNDEWIVLQNLKSGLLLGASRTDAADGAPVVHRVPAQQPDGETAFDQQWLPVPLGDGYYAFRNAGTPGWQALTVAGGSVRAGAGVVQATYDPTDVFQQWTFTPRTSLGAGTYWFVNRGSGKCLAIGRGGSVTSGTPAVQWHCGLGPDQQWWKDNN